MGQNSSQRAHFLILYSPKINKQISEDRGVKEVQREFRECNREFKYFVDPIMKMITQLFSEIYLYFV